MAMTEFEAQMLASMGELRTAINGAHSASTGEKRLAWLVLTAAGLTPDLVMVDDITLDKTVITVRVMNSKPAKFDRKSGEFDTTARRIQITLLDE